MQTKSEIIEEFMQTVFSGAQVTEEAIIDALEKAYDAGAARARSEAARHAGSTTSPRKAAASRENGKKHARKESV